MTSFLLNELRREQTLLRLFYGALEVGLFSARFTILSNKSVSLDERLGRRLVHDGIYVAVT